MTVQKEGKKQESFYHCNYSKYAEVTSAGSDWPHTHFSESWDTQFRSSKLRCETEGTTLNVNVLIAGENVSA